MKTSAAALAILALVIPSTRLVAQQQATPNSTDITGTWVINHAKSNFGGMPQPTIDSSTITRTGAVYQIDATSDFGGQGMQHHVLKWPVGAGETTNEMSNGATIHTITKVQNDTTTFTSTISVQGQAVAIQTGYTYRSPDGKTLTRGMDIQPLVGASSDPIHFLLVYDRK